MPHPVSLLTPWASVLAAGAEGAAPIDLGALLLGLFGGLALFLYGMAQMSDALKAVAGDRMRVLLARLTANRVVGAGVGALTTALIQSSSVTTVLVVGFVSAGLMTAAQSVGVIMGANVGTTITAQIIAFKVTSAALGMIAVGFAVVFFARRERTKLYGTALLGLGLVFYGMHVMGSAMRPLGDYEPFTALMARLEDPALGILVGTVFTALVQSSSATTGVVIVLAATGLVTLPAGIALILGANAGTCITALLAAVGKPREAVRAAAVHVVFNLVGILLWVAFVDVLADVASSLSPARDAARQVANAHTVFNVSNTVILLPFAPLLARLVQRLVPDRPATKEREVRAKYLDRELTGTPGLALDRARMELLHLGNHTKKMLAAILPAMLAGTRQDLAAVAARDDRIDVLHGQIITFLGRVSQGTLTEEQTADLVRLMEATNDLENIGDIIETNLTALGRRRIDHGVRISEETKRILTAFHGEVVRALDTALMAVTQTSVEAAKVVTGMKADINRMAAAAAAHGADRLVAPEPHRLPAYTIERDMLENLKRIFYFTRRMARVVVPRRR